ncbi:MAG: nucleoside hydrolase [Bacillota bacterium]
MQRRNVIIDTDPGVDDALALLLALRSDELNVLGITTVAGNLVLEKTSRNALIVVGRSGKHAPVLRGASGPLCEPLKTAEHAHGCDGLGDVGFGDPAGCVRPEHAVSFIIDTVMSSEQPVDLITLGPLTNVALALVAERRLEERVRSLVMMVGALTVGNITQVAEFNAGVDPEATDIVFRSRVPKTMVALDPIREGALIETEDVSRLEQAGTPWCQMAAQLLRKGLERWPRAWVSLCDPAAVAVAIDPSIAEVRKLPVVIETRGEHTRGMTVVDMRSGRGHSLGIREPNVNVVTRIHGERFRRLFMDTLLAR